MQARKDVPQHAAEPVSASQQPQTEVLAGSLGGEALRERGRVVHLVPLPRPCPSCVLLRSGACTRTRPFGPTASRGEPTVAVGARAAPSPAGSRSLMATARDTDKEKRPTHWCCG